MAATHRGRNELFRVGNAASFALKEIAENGNNSPMLARLESDPDVVDVVEAPGGPLVPAGTPGSAMFDDTTAFTINAEHGARRLSLASMLICTNDGFTGVNSLRLPSKVGHSVTVETLGYEARTEANTEDFADIVPPCQGLIGGSGEAGTGRSDPALAQNDAIRHHMGITGRRDLVADVHGWEVNAPWPGSPSPRPADPPAASPARRRAGRPGAPGGRWTMRRPRPGGPITVDSAPGSLCG